MKDSTEFEQFFKQNYSKFYFFTFHLIGDEEVSRDIVGDAFEYVWKCYRKSDVENWVTYIYSYLRNKSVDHIRHQLVHAKYAELYLQITREAEEDRYEEVDERVLAIRKVLKELTPRTRLILQECYINKKKYKEVAEDLEISESAVKKHIVQALKVIREKILKKDTKKVLDSEAHTSYTK